MATTVSTDLRIGGADINVFAYGNGFSSALHNITSHSEDGVGIDMDKFERFVPSGRRPGFIKAFGGLQSLIVTVQVDNFTMESMALSLGLALTDVTDNSGNSPPDLSIDVGAKIGLTSYEVEIKAPQDEDENLYDVVQLYKAVFMPEWNGAMTIQNERYIPLRIVGVSDPNNSYKIAKIYAEGTAP